MQRDRSTRSALRVRVFATGRWLTGIDVVLALPVGFQLESDRKGSRKGMGGPTGCWKTCSSTTPVAMATGLDKTRVLDGGLFLSRLMRLADYLRFWLLRITLTRLPNACTPATILYTSTGFWSGFSVVCMPLIVILDDEMLDIISIILNPSVRVNELLYIIYFFILTLFFL